MRTEADLEHEERGGQERDVGHGAALRAEPGDGNVRVQVAGQQRALEENETGHPNGGGTAEEREQLPRGNRFQQEEQKCGEKRNDCVEDGGWFHSGFIG